MGRMFLNCEVCGVAMSGFFARIRKLKGKKVRVCPNCRKAIDNRCLYEFEGEDDESGERGEPESAPFRDTSPLQAPVELGNGVQDTPAKIKIHKPDRWAKKWEVLK